MSKASITEYSDLAAAGANRQMVGPMGMEPGVDQADLSFTGTPGTSAAFGTNTRFVRIHVDGIAGVLFSDNATVAAVGNKRMAANATEYFGVKPGHFVSFITRS